jgi:hypothetical protein
MNSAKSDHVVVLWPLLLLCIEPPSRTATIEERIARVEISTSSYVTLLNCTTTCTNSRSECVNIYLKALRPRDISRLEDHFPAGQNLRETERQTT